MASTIGWIGLGRMGEAMVKRLLKAGHKVSVWNRTAAKSYGVAMPAAAATRESVSRMVGRGHDNIDFAVLLLETAKDAGLELKSENVKMMQSRE